MAIGTGFTNGFAPLSEVYSKFLKQPDDLHLITDYLYKVLIDVRTANFLRGNWVPEYHPVGLASHILRPDGLTVQENIGRTGRVLWETVSDDKRCSIDVVLALNGLDLEALWMYWSHKWSHMQHPWAITKRLSIVDGKEIEVVAGREFIINCALQSLTLDPQFGEGQRIMLERLITSQPGYEDHSFMQNENKRKEKETNFDWHISEDCLPFYELNVRLQKYKQFPYTLKDTPANNAKRRFLLGWDDIPSRYPHGAPLAYERDEAITSVIDQFITISQNVAQVFIRYPTPTLHQFRAAYRQTFDQLNMVVQNPFSSIDEIVRKDLTDDFCIRGAWDFIWYVAVGVVRSSTWRRAKRNVPGIVDLRRILFSTVLDAAMGHPNHPNPDDDQSKTVDLDGVIRTAICKKYGETAEQRKMWFSKNLARSFIRLDLDHYDLYARHGFAHMSSGPADAVEKRFFRSATQTMDRYNWNPMDNGEDYGDSSSSSPSSPETPTEPDSREKDEEDNHGLPKSPPEDSHFSSSDSDNENGGDGGTGGITKDLSTTFDPIWAYADGISRLPPLPPFPAPASRITHNKEQKPDVKTPPSNSHLPPHKATSETDAAYRPDETHKGRNEIDSTAFKASAVSDQPRSTSRRSQRRSKKIDDGDGPYRPSDDESDDEDVITSRRKLPEKGEDKSTGNGPVAVIADGSSLTKKRHSPSRAPHRRGRKRMEDEPYRPHESETEDEDLAQPLLQLSTSSQRRTSPRKYKQTKSDRNEPLKSKRADRDAPYHPSDSDPEDENLSSDGLITDDEVDLLDGAPEDKSGTSEADSLGGFLSPSEKETFDRFVVGQPGTLYPRISLSGTVSKKRASPQSQHDNEPAVKRSKRTPGRRAGPFSQSSSDEDGKD